jgi:hypothetical protein
MSEVSPCPIGVPGIVVRSIDAFNQKMREIGYKVYVNESFFDFRRHLANVGMYESPIFDPDEHDLSSDAFWLQVEDKAGRIVACHAERLFTCSDFVAEKVETDQIWASRGIDAERSSWRTEIQHPPVVLSGRVALAGSMFVDPEHRGTGVSLYLPYLSRSIAISKYGANWNTGLVRDNILNSRIPTLYYGYPRTALLFSGRLPRSNTSFQDIHLCWISRSESADKLHELARHPRYPLTFASHDD